MKLAGINFQGVQGMHGWYACDDFNEGQLVEERARAINVLNLAPQHTAICGLLPQDLGHRLYLAPTRDPLEVARAFRVGDEDCCGSSYHNEVMAQLHKVQTRYPFVPFMADAKGFKFVFLQGITMELAHFLQETITVGTENMLDADLSIVRSIYDRGYVHLWWD